MLAGWHYDLNFLSAHGKSRFPGLAVWLQDGRRLPVSIPDGCLLLQAGKQLEWLTGGHVRAGMHEARPRFVPGARGEREGASAVGSSAAAGQIGACCCRLACSGVLCGWLCRGQTLHNAHDRAGLRGSLVVQKYM